MSSSLFISYRGHPCAASHGCRAAPTRESPHSPAGQRVAGSCPSGSHWSPHRKGHRESAPSPSHPHARGCLCRWQHCCWSDQDLLRNRADGFTQRPPRCALKDTHTTHHTILCSNIIYYLKLPSTRPCESCITCRFRVNHHSNTPIAPGNRGVLLACFLSLFLVFLVLSLFLSFSFFLSFFLSFPSLLSL